jgi:starch synthase
VEPYNEEAESGTGFVIEKMSAEGIYSTVKRACETFRLKPEAIHDLRRRGMEKRFSWEKSAEKYLDVYRQAISRRLSG